MSDITCTPNPWAPGFWTISAESDRGRQWWSAENYPDIGWNLGAGSYMYEEVKKVLLAMPGGMVADLNGRQIQMVDQERTNG